VLQPLWPLSRSVRVLYNDLMHPTIFDIPLPFGNSLPIHSYGLMIVLGFLLSIWVASRVARRRGLPDFTYDLGLVMLLVGLLGGRIFYYVQNYADKYRGESFLEFFKIWKGGLVFYGGAIGGILGAAFYLWKKKLPLGPCLDVAAVATPLAMAFGRLGCFLNGCCYGGLCDPGYLFGLVFPVNSGPQVDQWQHGFLDGPHMPALPVQPVQLYQAAHDFLLFGLIYWYIRQPGAVSGNAMPLAFVLYGLGRFQIEFLRGDHLGTFTGLTVSQNFGLLTAALFGTIFILFLLTQQKRVTSGGEIPQKDV